mmetsp:Transcript_27997/g.41534  ORF Transcript_27997/g.41534 Transcript_27997/m.41534 type:complete len:312 (+) Transcript_27997:207-1142(+)
MNNIGGDLHNTLSSSSRKSSSLFHNERHGCSLVKKTKLSGRVSGITRVSENTSVKEGTVNISHHGSNVTGREPVSTPSGSLTPSIYDILHGLIPLINVGLVEGNNLSIFRDLDIRMRKYEFSNLLIKGEHVYSISEGNNKEGGRRIQTVSSSNEFGSGLKGVGEAISIIGNVFSLNNTVFVVFVDSNNGSSGDSCVNVGRSIERIEYNDVFVGFLYKEFLICPGTRKLVFSCEINRFILFFRSKNSNFSSETKSPFQKIIRNNIKLLLILSLNINLSLKPKGLRRRKLGSLNNVSNSLARSINCSKESGQL